MNVEIEVNEAVDTDDSLLLRLPFDDGLSPASDFSGLDNTGEIQGAVYVSDSADGSAGSLQFDGLDDTVDIGTLDVSGQGLTIAAWIKADSFPGRDRDPRVISKASTYAVNRHVFMSVSYTHLTLPTKA